MAKSQSTQQLRFPIRNDLRAKIDRIYNAIPRWRTLSEFLVHALCIGVETLENHYLSTGELKDEAA